MFRASSLRFGLIAVFAAVLLPVTPIHADSSAEAADRFQAQSELLGAWLDAQALQQRKERRFTGGSVLAVGAAGVGFGLALLIKSPNNELSKGGGVALTAAGAFGAALGIFRLVVESESEKIARRYRALSSEELDALQVARFEGELYAAAQHAHRIRKLARWLGLATSLSGVGVLIATPFADLSPGGRVAAYVSGGLLVLGGGVNFAGSFGTPPPIQAWDEYQRGIPPTGRRGALFGLAPMVIRRGFGAAFVVPTGRRARLRAWSPKRL